MKTVVKNIKNLILFSAILHLTILVIFAITQQDFSVLSYLNIIEINLLFPDFPESHIISFLVAIVIYVGIHAYSLKKS